jgi:hypothetical protein
MSKDQQPAKLDVYDPNENVPSEPPPSYDEALFDPSTSPPTPQRPPFQRPAAPPPHLQNVQNQHSYNRPPTAPPTAPPAAAHSPATHTRPQFPAPTPINPNPYLPWRYPSTHRCSKCENTGYKKKNGHPCKNCWKKFRPNIKYPPQTAQEMERLAKMPKGQQQRPNPNIVPLPPGTIPLMNMGPTTNRPLVLGPGDPRIGGSLCPRCKGRGLVHFFLDLETCPQCNGLGRVFLNPPM